MSRYVTLSDIEDQLDISINSTDYPKQSLVEHWIKLSEDEVDRLTESRWDLHKVENELIYPDGQTNEFILRNRPLSKIFSIEVNGGDKWDESWTTYASTSYRIAKANIAKVETKDYYWLDEQLRVTYEAGYETIPSYIKQLVRLLVEKHHLMGRLGQAASDTENVSVAVIRISDKSNASMKYKTDVLQEEINHTLSLLKKMKARNFRVFTTNCGNFSMRYRCNNGY